MQIKTITCHDVYNFGASLQAYALQTYLTQIGHEVEIIDYKPDYLCRQFDLKRVSNPSYNRPLIKQLYLLAKLPERLLALDRKKPFDRFNHDNLKLTRRYNSIEELRADPPFADVYIAGSDQIWNTFFKNGRDRAFYLDFGKPEVKRISYAASFATETIVPRYRNFVMEMLNNFNSVSVRERLSLPLLSSLGRPDGVAVCDPVFLVGEKEWSKQIGQSRYRKINKDYVLVYLAAQNKNIEKITRILRKKLHCKVYAVGGVKAAYADRNFTSIGPLEFLGMIRDAGFVISNSFHATAFSMIFRKKFCVVNREEAINERMKSLLATYGMEERLVSTFVPSLLNDIDYQRILPLLEKDIKCSKIFLQEAIG